MEIDTNFHRLQIGQTLCYHIGFLAKDREDKHFKYKTSKDGKLIKDWLSFTDDAAALQNAGNMAMRMSCSYDGTGELELKQRKLSDGIYQYLARRVR